jgi:hypothetical protein
MLSTGVYFTCASAKVENPLPYQFSSRYPLLSNFNNNTNLARDELYRLLLNLESHIANPIRKTTIPNCFWQMHIFCEICNPTSSDLVIYCYQDHFEVFITSFCPHQNWKVSKIQGRVRKLETRNDKGIIPMTKHHPFRIFGKHILDAISNELSNEERSFLEEHVFSHGHQFYQSLQETQATDLEMLLNSIPGIFFIELRDPLESSNCSLMHQDKEIVQLTYIHPLALSIVHNTSYFQIDASFKALKPYAFSIPLAIIQNDALPLGLQMSPTEKGALYETFFKHLLTIIHERGNPEFSFEFAPFLSDHGKGLMTFVESINGRHYFCYRHLIEAVGSSTFASLILRRLLFTSSFEEYQREVPQAISDLESLRGLNQLTDNQVRQFCDLFNWEFDGVKFTIKDNDPNHLYQNLWNRCDEGISTCSNHAERINRVCNKDTKYIQRFISKLAAVLKIIDDKCKTTISTPNRQGMEMLTFLAKRADELNLPVLDQCNHPGCQWGEIYSKRYNVNNFPCLHTAKSANVVFPPLPPLNPFITIPEIHINYSNSSWEFRDQYKPKAKNVEAFEQSETVQSETIISSLGPSGGFLYQVAREIMLLKEYDNKELLATLIQVSIEWGKYLAGKAIDETNTKQRAKFRTWIWQK